MYGRDRPELHSRLEQLRPGDALVVWKLDRPSRSLMDLLSMMERLASAGAGFKSFTEAGDTTTAAGRMLMQRVGALAEFQREMVRERVRAGLDAAPHEGRMGGRPRTWSASQRNEVAGMVRSGPTSWWKLPPCSESTAPP